MSAVWGADGPLPNTYVRLGSFRASACGEPGPRPEPGMKPRQDISMMLIDKKAGYGLARGAWQRTLASIRSLATTS